MLNFLVKVLDWGEDGVASVNEIAALRAAFRQEVTVWQKLNHSNVTKVLNILHIVIFKFIITTLQILHSYFSPSFLYEVEQ